MHGPIYLRLFLLLFSIYVHYVPACYCVLRTVPFRQLLYTSVPNIWPRCLPSFLILSSSLFTTFRHFATTQSEFLTSEKLQAQTHGSPPSPPQITYSTLRQVQLPSLASKRPSNGAPFTYSWTQGRNIIYRPGMSAVFSNNTLKMKQ